MIPRSKLAKIYAEMFVTDQWIQSKPGLRTIADTSLVYEPILQKYGYDSDDYQYSIDRYMDDPERFSRILRSTAEILDKEINALRKDQEQIKQEQERRREAIEYAVEMFYSLDELISSEGLKNCADSLEAEWDTLINTYRIRRVYRTDTIFQGPRIIVNDTIAVADSLKAKPGLAVTSPQAMEVAKGFHGMSRDTAKTKVAPKSNRRPRLLPPKGRPNN